ncbi:protein-glutamine gamma-glutamyltransferase 5-like isoform X3 [Etheostoma cragini]|uniref:protein-glutamine gamma-glutamyltransferase 5-like isoform X3 n=1 Tax=Etheostoma cragini TaxID=417921 RepID=UPI00155E9F35|nr:protein-glutamine gamma-glutamyltransferase 5-like isoform X3 [Etheostoma cragini]
MTEKTKESIYKGVDLHPQTNNVNHRTKEISLTQLIVRRGQPFKLTLNLRQPFNPSVNPLRISAATGKLPTEKQGTLSFFGVPDVVTRSPSAKAVWKVELDKGSSPTTGNLILTITPPADTPIGEYTMTVKHRDQEMVLAKPVVLFNPWCPDDWVYLKDENEINEYVMNEQGIIYKGTNNYIDSCNWDFGQFEDDMVDICLRILDLNPKHMKDPGDDVSARCNPIYVSRVVSAMINSDDDRGVLQGRWGGSFIGGVAPSHWTGSHAILKRWFVIGSYPVKYGQCWVYAGVMCSVMRLLGIPCRVVTNYESAHDNDKSLTVDVYHADFGVREKPSQDSVWNYHVWVEAWMRRPDLAKDGKYDGWQVLDPTPQEKSQGVYCCGPAPVVAILNGETDIKYDTPFVFAEVNADCIDWLVKADGSKVKIFSDTARVGQNISTKAVGSNKRVNITDSYKYREGTEKERSVFNHATTRDLSKIDEVEEEKEETEKTEEPLQNGETEGNKAGNETTGSTDVLTPVIAPQPPSPHMSMKFEEVTLPKYCKDVRLMLVLQSKNSAAMQLSINISVQAMRYNGSPAGTIQTEVKEETLLPGKDLSVPIQVPFSAYQKLMLECDILKVSALVTDKEKPDNVYLAAHDVALLDPPISITVSGTTKLNREAQGEVVFMNPVTETLKECTLNISGSGLLKEDIEVMIPDLKPSNRICVKFPFVPYKLGKKTLVANFDCSTFRDIKGSCTVDVKL